MDRKTFNGFGKITLDNRIRICYLIYRQREKEGLKMIKKIIIDGHEFDACQDTDFTRQPIFGGSFSSPMLVSEIPGHQGRINSQPYVFVQPKLDGHCCMANTRTRRLYSRQGHEITTLPHINAALPTTGPEWLHGELWRKGWTANDVTVAIKRGLVRVQLHVFDCVSDEGFGKRSACMAIDYNYNDVIKRVPTYSIDIKDITWNFYKYIDAGYEGMIIRLDGHGYYHGRSQNVFKMKPETEGV